MIVIDAAEPVHREVQLLAAAWALGPVDAVGRLLDFYYAHTTEPTSSVDEVDVAVHAIYGGVRLEGRYGRRTHVLTVTSEPLAGKSFTSPSTARTGGDRVESLGHRPRLRMAVLEDQRNGRPSGGHSPARLVRLTLHVFGRRLGRR
ncbi:hypothetical protein AB0J82_36470 [Asanoa sp. NPDC049518]|uniref:hypothetical protein n=1 Tax=unclassified Asanoa TaxID=2685164 RepID=UPI003422DE6E